MSDGTREETTVSVQIEELTVYDKTVTAGTCT
jgi:hypothetical protein